MHKIDCSKIVLHKGVYKKTASVGDAIFMITGMTIGAGVLGIPYAVAQVGLKIGLFYILILGLTVLCLNLMIGEVAVRTKENFQLPGFAGKYLGVWAKELMSLIVIVSGLGALLAYIVGEGQALSAIFGGDAMWWSVFFWSVMSFMVWRGLQTIKTAEKILSAAVITIILAISLFLIPQIKAENFYYQNYARIFLPFGIILFALHGAPAIAEAHALLPGSERRFRRALIIGTLIPIFVYIIFALAVVGDQGLRTTPIATIGLGQAYGFKMLFLANLFAVFAMGTGFMGLGTALKQSLICDHKVSIVPAFLFTVLVPLTLFMLGLRNFVNILDVVGGLFIGVEAVLIVLIYWRAKNRGDVPVHNYNLRHIWLLIIPVLLVFTFATLISIMKVAN